MKPKERILELRKLGKSDREIADAVGYRTLSGVRGVASRASRQTDCVNRDRAHITGRWYTGQPLEASEQLAVSIGIGAISDEDKTSSSIGHGSKPDET